MVCEWHQVSSGLQDYSWMISTMLWSRCSQFFLRFLFFSQPLRSVPSVPTTIGITVTLMFLGFLVLCQVFVYHFVFFYFKCVVRRNEKIHKMSSSYVGVGRGHTFFLFLFSLNNTWSCLLIGIRWFVCISKSQRIFCVSFSRTDSGFW